MTDLIAEAFAINTIPEALPRIRAAIEAGILTPGTWGDGNTAVCMMSAAVPGAEGSEDCVTAGWPKWLAGLNIYLFDAHVGADDEDKARQHFALSVAEAVSKPVDFDKAHDLFLIRRLDTGKYSALKTLGSIKGEWSWQIETVDGVVALLYRRAEGEDVSKELKNAAYAAYAASAAASVASAAAYAAVAVSTAASAADYGAYAAYAAYAADDTAADTAYAAYAAASVAADTTYDASAAAARDDLIWALREAGDNQ